MAGAGEYGPDSLLLVDVDDQLVLAWGAEFAAWPSVVQTRLGELQTVTDVDAFVTAGNSYGQMDGGVDRVTAERFPGVQRAV